MYSVVTAPTKIFEAPKYYAEDVGIRNAQLGFREQEATHLMENVIFCELVRRGYKVDVGVVGIEHVVDGGRELRQHEIDFVVNTGFGKIYIQSAYGMTTSGSGRMKKAYPTWDCIHSSLMHPYSNSFSE